MDLPLATKEARRPRAPRRLLIATNVPSTLTSFLLPFSEYYRSKGWRVDAVSNGVTQCDNCIAKFDNVFEIGWTRRPWDVENLTSAPRRLQQLVSNERYDIVHVHDPVAGFVTRYALRGLRRKAGVRVVYTAHGFHFYKGAPRLRAVTFRTIEWLANTWADRMVVINQEDLAAAKRFPLHRRGGLVYMPGIGVDMTKYDPKAVSETEVDAFRASIGLSRDQPLVLMVAEFNPGKRHRDAVAALAKSANRDIVLGFAGVGPLEAEVKTQADQLGVMDRVRFLGYRTDIPVLIRASRMLLLPSEREGLPRSIMEAASLERPVVATNIRGVTELVSEETGILCEVGDVSALSLAISRLASDTELAIRMGKRGRTAMSPFALSNVLALHDELYDGLTHQ